MLESLLGLDLYNHCNVEGIRKADNQVEQVFDASHNCHRLFQCVVVVRRTGATNPLWTVEGNSRQSGGRGEGSCKEEVGGGECSACEVGDCP